ncbi:MAG: hypothetical protein ABWK01_02845 [Infirmifilum sp.]
MGEIILGVWDFIVLVLGTIALAVLLIIIAIEYHHWRLRRELKKIVVRTGKSG